MKRLFALLAACAFLASPALAAPPSWASGVYSGHVTRGVGPSFTTFDPANLGTHGALSGGNLTFATDGTGGPVGVRSLSSLPAATCTHIEIKPNAAFAGTVGIGNSSQPISGASAWVGSTTNAGMGVNQGSNQTYNGSSHGNLSPSFNITSGQWLAIEINTTTHLVQYNNNNAGWTPAAGMNYTVLTSVAGTIWFYLEIDNVNASGLTANFGGSAWAITPNSGCVGLS